MNVDDIQHLTIADTLKVIHILSDLVCTKVCSKFSCQCLETCEEPCKPSAEEADDLSIKTCSCFSDLEGLIDEHLKELKVL